MRTFPRMDGGLASGSMPYRKLDERYGRLVAGWLQIQTIYRLNPAAYVLY